MNIDDKQIKYIVCKPEEIPLLEKELEMLPVSIGQITGTPKPSQPIEIAVTFDDTKDYDVILYVDFEGMHRGSAEIQDQYDDMSAARAWESKCEREGVAVGMLPQAWRNEVSRMILEDIVKPTNADVAIGSFPGGTNHLDIRYSIEGGEERSVRISMLYDGVN